VRTRKTVALACLLGLAGMLGLAAAAQAIEAKAVRLTEDFGSTSFEECNLQYYYYVPCPTYSWFWGFFDWSPGDKVGQFYNIGDKPTAGFSVCDSVMCQHITGVRILDFSGYGQAYPGLYTVQFDVYCSDERGCPVGPSLWTSLPYETIPEWNTIPVDPPLAVTTCSILNGPDGPAKPRILVTATHVGTDCTYPQWGMDNISGVLAEGCQMHDAGCLPALYPRPQTSHYPTIHSGYYGVDFQFCPPVWFADGGDTTQDASMYGYLEFAWRLMIRCLGNPTEPTTWGSIKAIYK
jgi:hypothetical protein